MPWRVLVVDDDVTVGLSLALSEAGIKVRNVTRIAEALALVQQQRFDAVVCDRRMPDGDGLTFVEQLRNEPRTADLPVLMLTADHDEANRASVLAAGANTYLAKPIEPAALVAAIAALIDRPMGASVAAQPHTRREPSPPPAAARPARVEDGDLRDLLQKANERLALAVVDANQLRRAAAEHDAALALLVAENARLRAEVDALAGQLEAEQDVGVGESARRLAKKALARSRRTTR